MKRQEMENLKSWLNQEYARNLKINYEEELEDTWCRLYIEKASELYRLECKESDFEKKLEIRKLTYDAIILAMKAGYTVKENLLLSIIGNLLNQINLDHQSIPAEIWRTLQMEYDFHKIIENMS